MAPAFSGKFESGLRRRISTVGWITPVEDASRVAQRRWKEALISVCHHLELILGINWHKSTQCFTVARRGILRCVDWSIDEPEGF